MFNKQVVMVAVLATLLTSFAGEAQADLLYTLDGNQTINAGANISGTVGGTTTTWTRGGSPAGYYLGTLSSFTSTPPLAAVPDGLDFNNKTLATTDGTSLVFDLNGKAINDTGLSPAGGTSLSTYRGLASSGSV
ncbi:MAG: hypothetical protein PHU85_05290, partial [Phycisphaerae bacterium]|nr:hypothetical protein [Phycisphaerae bacterium]